MRRSRLKLDSSPFRFVQDDIDQEMGTIASCARPSKVGLNLVKSGEMLRAEHLLGLAISVSWDFAIKEHAMLAGEAFLPSFMRSGSTEDADQSSVLITIR